ncbi:MAG: hypothetical protein ACE5K9_11645 [Candidatus Methylomirabilales bacterium]
MGERWKWLGWGVGVGIVATLIVTLATGWLVTSGKMDGAVEAAVLKHQAALCEERVRADPEYTGDLDWQARRKLAEKHSVMPGEDSSDSKVASECSFKLS